MLKKYLQFIIEWVAVTGVSTLTNGLPTVEVLAVTFTIWMIGRLVISNNKFFEHHGE